MKFFGMCLNWKVLVGLVVVGLGVWAVAPNLVGAAVPLLLVAACPLSMFFMMRGMGGMGGMGGGQGADQPQQATLVAAPEGQQPAGSLAELKARSAGLQAQHERIAREIARLETEDSPVVREAAAVARAADEPVRR